MNILNCGASAALPDAAIFRQFCEFRTSRAKKFGEVAVAKSESRSPLLAGFVSCHSVWQCVLSPRSSHSQLCIVQLCAAQLVDLCIVHVIGPCISCVVICSRVECWLALRYVSAWRFCWWYTNNLLLIPINRAESSPFSLDFYCC